MSSAILDAVDRLALLAGDGMKSEAWSSCGSLNGIVRVLVAPLPSRVECGTKVLNVNRRRASAATVAARDEKPAAWRVDLKISTQRVGATAGLRDVVGPCAGRRELPGWFTKCWASRWN